MKKKEGGHRPGAVAADVCNGLLISNKSSDQKATSQAIEKSAELCAFWWLFGPENAISAEF
jgi:hypothetical protein